MTTFITNELDKKHKCIGVFLDLAKAFDTVCHSILYHRLHTMGIRENELNWFQSYTTNRTQRVRVDNIIGDPLTSTFGVPQRSVLRPILFLIYVNDLCTLQLQNARIIAFADDTAVLFSGKNQEEAFTRAETGLKSIKEWLDQNLLTLNTFTNQNQAHLLLDHK